MYMKFDIIESNHCVFFVYYTQKLFFLFLGFPDLKKIKVFSIIRCDRGRVLVNSQFLVSLAAQHWKQGSQKNRSEVWFIWGLFGIQSCFLNFLTALYVSVFFFSQDQLPFLKTEDLGTSLCRETSKIHSVFCCMSYSY